MKVIDFYERIEKIAPFKASSGWDNTGLLIGDMDSPVYRVLLALDVTDTTIDYAISQKIDLIISHHPVIFQPLKSICQKKILRLIEHKIAVISAHTNLDVSRFGVNFVLAKKLSLDQIKPLSMSSDIPQYQINVYVPDDNLQQVMSAMHHSGAGTIGNYSHCATFQRSRGQFKPLPNSTPYQGQVETVEKIKEIKLEVVCEETHLTDVIKAMIAVHPYETPAYTVIPLKQKSQNFGLGCWGTFENAVHLKDFADFVRSTLGAPFVKLWTAGKPENTLIKNVAVCGGSGNSIIHEAKRVADVFISADFSYHFLLDAPMPVIDAGHFWTEYPVLNVLATLFQDMGCEINILPPHQHDIANLKLISHEAPKYDMPHIHESPLLSLKPNTIENPQTTESSTDTTQTQDFGQILEKIYPY